MEEVLAEKLLELDLMDVVHILKKIKREDPDLFGELAEEIEDKS